jgi:cell cycle checkpoint protein
MFDEFNYHPEAPQGGSQQPQSQQHEDPQSDNDVTKFEIPLNTLIECMNIFGSSGISATSKSKKWRKKGHDDGGQDNDDDRRTGPLHNFFSSEKGTSMRMSYRGSGHPLTLFMSVSCISHFWSFVEFS